MGIKSLFKHLLLTTAVLSIYACGGGGESSNKTETIIEVQKQQSTNLVFADQKLTDCVQALIDSEGYTLVEEIKQLTCSGKAIVDIEGIQNLSSLEILNLSNNQIRDITPISKLGRLKQLYLQGNNLQLLSPITANQLLEQVDISNNDTIICSEQTKLEQSIGEGNLTANQPCIEGMQQAQDVTFEDPNLQACIRQTAQDIGALHLEQIQQLKCVNHAISDIDGIEQLSNLRELDLTQNNISDITPLQGLALLKKVLLGKNQISNTQPLTTSKYMQELRLDYNQLTDIQDVQTLDALRQIHLTNNQIRDLTPLQSLTGLLELRISNNRIIDIDSLSNLPKLSSLWIQGNQIADLTPLGNLQNLEQLWLSNNWLTDLTPLQTQSKLKWLHLDGTEAADLQPLNKLTQLKWLQLDNTRVDDISAIYPLAQLDWLHLKGNDTIPCSQLDQMEEILTPEKIDRPATCSQPQEQRGTVISTIEFQDQALKDCIYDAAREQGVASADELTTLSCPEADITDITELTQFPGITSIDLTGNDHISCAQLEQLQDRIGEEALTRPEQCNLPPTVAAQQEQTVTIGTQVDLNAEATDPNGDSLTYNWQQTAGQSVQLTNPNTATPNFTAPQGEDQTITFQLTVTDQYGLSTTQTINILVTAAILGSKDNPFLVTNYEDLKKVGTGIDSWNLDSHYLQTADIDATPSKTENPIPEAEEEYYGFEPIGNGDAPFTGGYDGGGFEIDGLTINRPEEIDVGLFRYGYDASLININLKNVGISGGARVGGIAGFLTGESPKIANSYVSGQISGESLVGGLAGVVTTSMYVIISDNYFEGIVSGDQLVGGLVGQISGGYDVGLIRIENSYSTGTINVAINQGGGLVGLLTGIIKVNDSHAEVDLIGGEYFNSHLGGIVGQLAGISTINSSYAVVNIDVKATKNSVSNIGGLIGAMGGSSNSTSNSYSSGTISISSSNTYSVGGFIGLNSADMVVLNENNSSIDISTNVLSGSTVIGGFIGYISTQIIDVSKCYSNGDITIALNENSYSGYIGGFVGLAGGSGRIEKSYASGNVVANTSKNVDVENGVGGFIGVSSVDLDQVYATGNVVGKHNVGGLVGKFEVGELSNSYARGNVTGNSQVGGLVGQMTHYDGDDENPATYSSITNSYSTGQVSLQNEEFEPIDFGGLVGANTSELNTVTNSFWDVETSGIETSAGGEPKTSEELKTTATFTNAGWDFDETWMILSDGYTYPRLSWNTIEVSSWTELRDINDNPGANVILTRDLQATDPDYAEVAGFDANIDVYYENGSGWIPIGGNGASPFSGSFDGGGHTIDGMVSQWKWGVFVGLFGRVNNADIVNINMANVLLDGQNFIGGIIGQAKGSSFSLLNSSVNGAYVERSIYDDPCYNRGGVIGGIAPGETGNVLINNVDVEIDVSAHTYVGGVVAAIYGGIGSILINNVNYSGDVVGGSSQIGGLVGILSGNSTISSSSVVGNVITGTTPLVAVQVGGIVGLATGPRIDIYDSFSSANVYAVHTHSGGIIGQAAVAYSSVVNSYNTGNIEGEIFSGGLFGSFGGAELVIENSYSEGNINGTLGTGGLAGSASGANIEVHNSYAKGDIHGTENVGGLFGKLYGNISNSYAIGAINGGLNTGGLVGLFQGNITDSFANVGVTGVENAGGIAGIMYVFSEVDDENPAVYSSIENSYSTGEVVGDVSAGGLLGYNDDESNSVSSSFWDIETSGQEASAGGIGLTTTEMQDQYTFESAGWDFDSVWELEAGSYPALQ